MNNIKNFKEFTNAVLESIKAYLPDRFAKADISLTTVTKNNDLQLTGLIIKMADKDICPTIYLEKFFEDYEDGKNLDKVFKEIARCRVNNEFNEDFNIEMITDYAVASKHILPRLINKDMNVTLLQERPHKIIEDLAVVYAIELGNNESGEMSTPITNQLLERWNITVDVLHSVAIKNLEASNSHTFMSMSEIMSKMMLNYLIEEYGDEESAKEVLKDMLPPEDGMYVLSNDTRVNGAVQLLNRYAMEDIIERIGEHFYIIPSSIHEAIMIPAECGVIPDELRKMVLEVNTNEVQPTEMLSNNIYTWRKFDGLEIVE